MRWDVVVSKMEITTQHGAMDGKTQTHEVDFYNLDAIIAVGYRVCWSFVSDFDKEIRGFLDKDIDNHE